MGPLIYSPTISPKFTVALDSMLFIYLLDASTPQLSQTTKRLFSRLESQKIKSITSVISLLETLSSSALENSPDKIDEYDQFFQKMAGLTVFSVTWEISLKAAQLRRKHRSLKTPDSIQLATALTHNADIFATNDNRLKNLSFPNLKILPITQL